MIVVIVVLAVALVGMASWHAREMSRLQGLHVVRQAHRMMVEERMKIVFIHLVWAFRETEGRPRYFVGKALAEVQNALTYEDLQMGDLMTQVTDPPKVIPTRPVLPPWIASPDDIARPGWPGIPPVPRLTEAELAEMEARFPVLEKKIGDQAAETLDPEALERARELDAEARRIEEDR